MRSREKTILTCAFCLGQSLIRNCDVRKGKKYCSKICVIESTKRKLTKTCRNCCTEQAIKKLAFTVNNLSPERIHQELIKTAELGGKALATYIRKLDRVGVLDKILPEISELKKYFHSPAHHPEGATVVPVQCDC